MENQKPCFRFEIDNFSEKKGAIASQTFISGGCEWFLYVYPKGNNLCEDYLRLYNANSKSLGSEWKGSAHCYFSLLNQSDKEIYRSSTDLALYPFGAKAPSCVFATALPLSKLREKGLLEEDRVIIEVYIKVVKAVSKKKETVVDNISSQDYASQVELVRKIFAEHPEVAEEFKPKKQVLNALRNACSKVSELVAEVKVHDWLKSKLNDFSSESKKADDDLGEVPLVTKKDADDVSRVQHLEERIKNLEQFESRYKMDCFKLRLKENSLEKKQNSYDANVSLVQKLEERVKNLELMENGSRLDILKSRLEEITLERNNSYDADGSKVQLLEDRVWNLELMENSSRLDSLKSKLEEISEERKNSYDADGSKVHLLEDRVKNLELMENGLRLDRLKSKLEEVSLEKKKSEADGSKVQQQLEDRVKNLELMENGLRLDSLKSKLEEVSLEKKKVQQQLEDRVKNLELMENGLRLDSLKSKLEEVSLEKKESEADVSKVQQQLEDRVKNLELMVSDLKVELDNEKAKSSADDFLLVD